MKNDIINTLRFTLEIVGVVLIILLTIGFFNTPFDNGEAIRMTDELVAEREYVEYMAPAIEEFTQKSLKIKETNELSNQGKIVPMKVAQVYSETFKEITKQYNDLSSISVPERFKQFHVSFLKAMEYQGASINETLVYLENKEPSHLKSVEKYNELFIQKYNESVNLFNRLLEERKVK